MPRGSAKPKLGALDGKVRDVATRRGEQRDIQALVITRGIGCARCNVVGQLAGLFLRHDVRQGDGDAIGARAVAILDALANLRVGVEVPIELGEAQVIKVNTGNGILARVVRIRQRGVDVHFLDSVLLVVVFHPRDQAAFFGTALNGADELRNIDVADAAENLVESSAGNGCENAVRLLDRIVPVHIVHEDLGRIGAVDDRAIGQRNITDKAQQILQEHRVDTDDAINVLAILGLPQSGDTLRVAGPVGRIGVTRVVQVTVVAEQRLVLFVDALDCLILATCDAGDKVVDRHLAVGNRDQALRATKAAAGTNLNIVHGIHEVVARLAVGTEHLGENRGDLLRRVNRAAESGKTVLGLINQLGHLRNMRIANTLDLLVGALEHLRAAGKRIGNGLQRRDVDHPVLEQLAGCCLRKVVGHGNQRVARDIGQSVDHGTGRVDVAAVHRNKRSRRPQRARGLRLHAIAELVDLLRIVGQRRKIARRDLVLKAADNLDSLLRFALYGLCRVEQHKATRTKRNEKHRDNGGDNGANMALLALALAMTMTDQTVRG